MFLPVYFYLLKLLTITQFGDLILSFDEHVRDLKTLNMIFMDVIKGICMFCVNFSMKQRVRVVNRYLLHKRNVLCFRVNELISELILCIGFKTIEY